MANEILAELWRIKDELSAKAKRSTKTATELMDLMRMGADGREIEYIPDAARRAVEIQRLRKDHTLAIASLKAAIESLDDVSVRVGALLTFSRVAEAYDDLAALAIEAEVIEEPHYLMLAGRPIPSFRKRAEYLAWFDRQLEEFNSRA